MNKKEIIIFINKHDKFWSMVDYINWSYLTNYGKNENHQEYMNKAKEKLCNYIKLKERDNKLNKINNKNFEVIQKEELFDYYKKTYLALLDFLNKYFKDLWLGKDPEYPDGFSL